MRGSSASGRGREAPHLEGAAHFGGRGRRSILSRFQDAQTMTSSPALDAAVETLRLTREAMPSRWSDDTPDELLGLVQLSFHDYVVAVLADPMPPARPEEGRPALAMRAALHGRAVAGLLTTLALAQWKETGAAAPMATLSKAPARLTEHWIDQIAAVARAEDGPAHDTAVDYVRGAAMALGFAARVLGAQKGLSLDPDDPRGPVEVPAKALSNEDAAGLLVWSGAAALCIAARLQPGFRIAR